jgi:hypothetical protein
MNCTKRRARWRRQEITPELVKKTHDCVFVLQEKMALIQADSMLIEHHGPRTHRCLLLDARRAGAPLLSVIVLKKLSTAAM